MCVDWEARQKIVKNIFYFGFFEKIYPNIQKNQNIFKIFLGDFLDLFFQKFQNKKMFFFKFSLEKCFEIFWLDLDFVSLDFYWCFLVFIMYLFSKDSIREPNQAPSY